MPPSEYIHQIASAIILATLALVAIGTMIGIFAIGHDYIKHFRAIWRIHHDPENTRKAEE